MEGSEEEMGGGLEESVWPLLGPPLKFVTLMMVMRLIIKSITSVTSIAKPVVIPGMVPIVVVVVVASPILVVIFASESVVVIIIIVVAVPLITVVVAADSPVADSIHHLVVLIALEWILLLHSVSLLIATIREVCLHLLRPTSIHFGVPIIFQLPLSVFPALICQLPVHVRLLTVPAANRSPVATVRKLIQLTDDVVTVTIVVAVMVTIAITIVVVTIVAVVLTVVRLVTGRQWTAACTVSVHVAVVGRGGITGSGRRSVVTAVSTVTVTATAAAGLKAIVAHFPETGLRFDYGW